MNRLLIVILSLCWSFGYSQKSKEFLYVGTFSVRGSQGIYVYEFNRAKGRMKEVQVVKTLESPSFIAVHPSGKYLYSVNRGALEEMPNSGSVSSYRIDETTGQLTLLNQRPSYGSDPCHISFDKSGRWAFVSNYSEGNFVIFPVFDDGLLGSASDSRKHTGSSINPGRQKKSYVHSATISPDNRYLIVCDLGTDLIHSYRFDDTKGRILSDESSFTKVNPGSGPRHFTFSPKGTAGYVVEELSSTVCQLSYEAASGKLRIVNDSVLSLPETYKGANTAADIHIDKSGKFLYMTNRGSNTITSYEILTNGSLNQLEIASSKGNTPRNFWVDSKGEFLMVANQDSDAVAYFRLDKRTGRIRYTGLQWRVPSPVSLQMLSLPSPR